GIVVFVLEHFSKYVIAAEKPDGSPDTGDYSNVALYSAMAMLSILGMGVVVLKKKAF
ncbi:MAG: LPXTG cell wall anchor domain-containing protein, partial [Ruminococcaceae bacterium]|nr:LPXTG cell wall anchor domain-containing protein [Oscillospiraceae bacterium]